MKTGQVGMFQDSGNESSAGEGENGLGIGTGVFFSHMYGVFGIQCMSTKYMKSRNLQN